MFIYVLFRLSQEVASAGEEEKLTVGDVEQALFKEPTPARGGKAKAKAGRAKACLLYTSDAADE